MHTDAFKIYIDRLSSGKVQAIEEELSPDFLAVDDEELTFNAPVCVKARAYIAETELIVHFDVETKLITTCSVCNGPLEWPVHLRNWVLVKPVAEIKGGIFDYSEPLREEILVSIPFVMECNGECPKRGEYKDFLKPGDLSDEKEGYHPFADL